MSATDWIIDEIKKVCLRFPKREAGAETTKGSMRYMKEQARQWADRVEEYPFRLAPRAFIGSVPLQAACDLAGTLGFWCFYLTRQTGWAWVSAAMFAASILLFIFEYTLYCRFSDRLYPKKNSFNVLATRTAAVESRQKIILCGHADAACEMPFLLHLKTGWIIFLIIIADIGKCAYFLFGLLAAICARSEQILRCFVIIESVGLLFSIPFFFFADWKRIVDGANDNLTGCYLGLSILKEMAEKGERLCYTDLCCLITDGEESGLRGAMAYAETHRQELLEQKAIVIAVDTIHDPNELMIYHRGINFTQKNSPTVCKLLHDAGLSCGIDIPKTDFYPGANDSEAFSRNGIPAAALCAVSHHPTGYYHTRYDSWDNLNPEGITLTRNVLLAAIKLFDEKEGLSNDL